jgi:hypothetical protein
LTAGAYASRDSTNLRDIPSEPADCLGPLR